MCEKYSRSLLRISVAQICQNLGWNSAQSSSLEVLTDVLERYILKIGGTCRKFSDQYGRTEANLNDLGLAFQHLGISISELEDYVHHVEPVPFAHEVVAFPATKTSNLAFPNPRSREILQHREEHVPEHLPYMFPNMKDEIPEDKTSSSGNGVDTPLKVELGQENGDEANVGDKRPAPMSTPDLPPSKRPRFGNSNLPEEAGHSQYEMTCVFMGPNGVLTTRQGCQGRLPEPRMPPPNPRTLTEGANKENSGKTKDSAGGQKISISAGGVGTDSMTSGKGENKKSRKSPQKKRMLHEQGAKLSAERMGKDVTRKSFSNKTSIDGFGKELGKKSKTVLEGMGKKSVSSKAAAKFLKKLKLSKKSSKLFSKSKVRDQKLIELLKDGSSPEKPKRLGTQTNVEGGKRRREKKSSDVVDFDEELRNLTSPSTSRVPSPEQPITTDAEGGAKLKARMEAIDDSINAVLRDGPTKEGKIQKRKKKEVKSEEVVVNVDFAAKGQADGKAQEPKIKRKPGRPPKVQKPPEPPPPVDVKPFVSDRYSSEELQVYEFNDSPPDTSISSRRPSASETMIAVAPSLPPPPPPLPPPTQPVVKHEQTIKHPTTSSSSSHKFHRKIEPEDDLFAPEIKIESRVDHSDSHSVKPFKLELSKDKEKQKVKDEKKERAEDEKGSKKTKDEKVDRRRDKKEKQKERSRDDKEKNKEKEHRKERKEKKEKEKKKRHKVKDYDKDKEKDKKPEEKVKQESRESRESSPAVGVGVKLKIKIGGSAGTPTSMMVTGEGSSPASPVPSFGSKRESMSPPRVVPKLYISKKGQGVEEKAKKPKKPVQLVKTIKHKSSPLAVSVKSSQSASPSSSKTSPSPRSTPTPPVPRKTPTPPPRPKSANKERHSPHMKSGGSKQKEPISVAPAKERKSRLLVKGRTSKIDGKKKERTISLSSLSSMSSSSSPSVSPIKSPVSRRQTPPRLERMSSSSSPEKSPPSLPFQSPTPSPRASSSAARSPSRMSSPNRSPTPPPPLSRRKPTPPPALSPFHSPRQQSHSPPPTRPPTPGSTSPPPSPDWNLPVSSPSHPRSPTPTPRTPTASPSRNIPSPSHSTPPGSPIVSHRSPSPSAQSSSRPGSRLLETPEPKSHSKDNPSPASSGKSSSSAFKPARTVKAETVCVFYDDSGQKVWICPACKLPDDGSEMIGCDMCDNWYHWPCVGITEAPPEEQQWFCSKCFPKSSSRGRGRPRGRGRGRGRKKIT